METPSHWENKVMKVTAKSLMAIITFTMLISGGLYNLTDKVVDYHDTLATKQEMEERFLKENKANNMIWVNLRISDVQDSISFYQSKGVDNLDTFGVSHYEKLQKTLERLEVERDSIMRATTTFL